MLSLSYKNRIKYVVFCSLFFLGGCSTYMSAWDTRSCSERGGEVVNKCIMWHPGTTNCQRRDTVCVGGMSYDAYQKQKQQKSSGLSAAPPPKLSEEEKAAKKLEGWKKRLDLYATEKWLTNKAHKYPKLSWLSSRWCLKGSDSKIPANYYDVDQNGIGGLEIHYADIDVPIKHYTHVHITGNYFDLSDRSRRVKSIGFTGESDRRLEKISDKEFTLLYKLKGWQNQPGSGNWTKEQKIEFAASQGQKPEVFVKCE
jgi:hypothetical protein